MAKAKAQAQGEGTVWKDRKHFMWWPLSFHSYEIRNGRLFEYRGLLNQAIDELLLYRVTDIHLHRTLRQRLFGTGTIILSTRADSTPTVRLENIAQPVWVREVISQQVEYSRVQHRVVGQEMVGQGRRPDMNYGFDDDCPIEH